MNSEGFLKADVQQGVSNVTDQEKYLKKYDIIWLTTNAVKDLFQSLVVAYSSKGWWHTGVPFPKSCVLLIM